MPAPDFSGVVVAAGRSSRFGGAIPKPFLSLAGRTVLERSVRCLSERPSGRGVVVVLREPFGAGTTLKQPAKSRIAELGAVAKRHPSFPVLVVVHSAHGNPSKADEARGKALVEALKQAGATTAQASAVGDANPVVPGRSKRNERVEIVFVAPAQ